MQHFLSQFILFFQTNEKEKQIELMTLKGNLGSKLVKIMCQLSPNVVNSLDGFDVNCLCDVKNLFDDIDNEQDSSNLDVKMKPQANTKVTLTLQSEKPFEDDNVIIDDNFSSDNQSFNIAEIASAKSEKDENQEIDLADSLANCSLPAQQIALDEKSVDNNEESKITLVNDTASEIVDFQCPEYDNSDIFYIFYSIEQASQLQQPNDEGDNFVRNPCRCEKDDNQAMLLAGDIESFVSIYLRVLII